MKGFGIAAFVAMALAGGAEVVTNAFVVAEADGVRMASDGSIHFARRSPVSVKVTARPGWKVNGRRSLRFVRSSGESGTLRVTSVLGEDGEHVPYRDCTFDCTLATNHLSAPVIRADAPERILAMYALPASNAFVSASATSTLVSNGVHEIVRTWTPCPECGAERDPPEERWTVDMVPCSYDWTARGGGTTTNSNTWAGLMSKGTDQTISFDVIGQNPCEECVCHASTNTLVDVHELSITNDLYLGLDRTDAGRSNVVTRTAIANIRPLPSGRVAYSWTDCGKICSFTGRTDQASVRYCARNSGDASRAHLAEPLTVMASITNVYGLSASATCTTNFTVVKVDVTIGGIGETEEEPKGAFVQFAPDAPNGQWTEEGSNVLVNVSITCEPTNLPPSEVVSVTVQDKSLYALHRRKGRYVAVPNGFNFAADIVGRVPFFLHGHEESGTLTNKAIDVKHKTSEARDLAKYTNAKLRVTNIRFNHDTTSSTKDAINIRRSFADGIAVANGEWINVGGGVTNEPFCYTTNRAVTILARLEASNFMTSAVVQAECLGAKGSLSDIMPTNVAFSGGVSSPEYIEFTMKDKTLPFIDCSRGGILQWKATDINGKDGGSCKMNSSGPHTVYTILDEPKSPWVNTYGEQRNAWTNALEFVIVKAGAAGKTTDKDALAAITAFLHGGHNLVYDTIEGRPRFGLSAGGGEMNLSQYLLDTNVRASSTVNCYDQAGAVVSIGSLCGTRVEYAYMRPFGYINEVKLVGVGNCNNPFFMDSSYAPYTNVVEGADCIDRSAFGNHAFATLGTNVFDACAGPVRGISLVQYTNTVIDTSTPLEARAANGGRVYPQGESFSVVVNGHVLLVPVKGVTGLK